VLAVGTVVTWHGLPSLLAAVAAVLSTIGRMQGNEASLRAWMLASTPFWAAHDLVVGSLPGLIADHSEHGNGRDYAAAVTGSPRSRDERAPTCLAGKAVSHGHPAVTPPAEPLLRRHGA
jgi:Bacterial inner membrane protein